MLKTTLARNVIESEKRVQDPSLHPDPHKMSAGYSWEESNPPSKVHGNPFSSFCVIPFTNQHTNESSFVTEGVRLMIDCLCACAFEEGEVGCRSSRNRFIVPNECHIAFLLEMPIPSDYMSELVDKLVNCY